MHFEEGLHFVWQFILLTKRISSDIAFHFADKCMLSNTLFPLVDEKYFSKESKLLQRTQILHNSRFYEYLYYKYV